MTTDTGDPRTRWFDLDEARLDLAQRAHRFVEERVRRYQRLYPDAEWSAPESRVPWELLDDLDGTGLRTLGLPGEAGGSGPVDTLTYVVVAEELARGESALIDIVLQGWKVGSIVATHAGAEVRRLWLGRFAAEPRLLFSHCSSEPQGSSDRWLNHDVPEAAMRTTAVRDGSGWVINGRKQFITNGPDSSLYVVYATTTPGVVPSQGTSSFLVPRDTPGFTIGETYEKTGGRLFNNAELIFENCRVTDDHLLILDGASGTSGRTFPASKAIIAAQAVGLAQAAYEAAADFAISRVQGGRPIIQHQAVALRLAEMATRIEAARALVRQAAVAIDRKASHRRPLAYMAKVAAGETAFEVARQAVELHGGLGVMRHAGVERLLRDATLFFHLDGTNDIHRFRIIKDLFPESAGAYAERRDDVG
ncbi:MAG TPA: acyl-CoA dehydrogenase family protein, partial [Acidimicrobiia bacterium]|nr:acyl-CoA dehydrogenase family protein [Acidimicrobiia bacterium]